MKLINVWLTALSLVLFVACGSDTSATSASVDIEATVVARVQEEISKIPSPTPINKEVIKEVIIEKPVYIDKPVYIEVEKPLYVEIKSVEIVEKPVFIEKIVEVIKEVEKEVLVPVYKEKIVEKIVNVPVEVVKEVIVEKIVEVIKEVPVIEKVYVQQSGGTVCKVNCGTPTPVPVSSVTTSSQGNAPVSLEQYPNSQYPAQCVQAFPEPINLAEAKTLYHQCMEVLGYDAGPAPAPAPAVVAATPTPPISMQAPTPTPTP